ncbi:helix-turn-helix domain-containing protein [uncultured Flavonifractor sp.]|uniref:helix-turn-helix domain-containing protein n=1 Tax=uncultured Flavonifractor sp. TaxID=1193534 RepID=UPI001749B552|nr:helix-turn-helix domain-containing protein [uncultured Flavonifractor sp.]
MRGKPRYKLKIIVLLSVAMTALLLCSTLAVSAMLHTSLRRQVEENGWNTVAQLRSSTETILTVMNDSLVQMALDPELQSFSDRYELLDIFDREELYQRLYQFRAVNRFIEKLYIHYYVNNMVLDLNGKDPRLVPLEQADDRERIAAATELTLAERYDYPITLFNLAGEGEETILYVTKPASPIAHKPSAVIVVTLRQSYLQEILQAISLDPACGLYVTDRNGRYLFGKNGDALADGDKYAIEIASADTGWTFHYELPEQEINRRVSSATRLLWIVTAGMAVLSVVGVCFLAQELYKPVRQLMQEKAAAERLLEENRPFLLEDTLQRLLEPSETPEEEWQARLQRYGAACRLEGCYTAIVLAFEQYEGLVRQIGEPAFEERLLYRLQWLRDWAASLPDAALDLVRDRRVAKYTLILSLDSANIARAERRTEELARQIFAGMREGTTLPVTMGVGHTYSHLTHLCASYEEAVAAYQYRAMAGDDRILYAKLLPDLPDQGFLFPNRLAQGVFQTIRQGSAVAAEEKLEQFFRYVREHLYPNSHPSYVAVQLFNSTLQFLQELSIDARNIFPDLPGESARLLQFETLDAVEQYFHNLALRLLDYLYQQRTQPKERVSQIIRDFLDEHYADDGITLTLLAEELHFSSSYLAKAFKSDTDKSIKEYITCKRIEAAKELLRDKNAKVGDVARQVGYTNSRSFINIFKKYTGLTPGEYKEQL